MTRRDALTTADPKVLLRLRPMTGAQILAVALCVAINTMDGFDILAASFTAPAIAKEWLLSPVELGLLLSAGLGGMVVGAVLLSPLADYWGRRRTVLFCFALVTGGLAASAMVPGYWTLVGARAATGGGVAAMMATINTATAEYANDRRRDFAVVLQAAGFPLGATIGSVAVYLLPGVGWRWIFAAGAGASLLLASGVIAWLPESLDFLIARRPPRALERANQILVRFSAPLLASLPERPRSGGRELNGEVRLNAFIISASFFLLMFTFYFFTSWTPKLLDNVGFSARGSVYGAVFMNLGGVIGDLAVAALVIRWSAQRLAPLFLVSCFATVLAFAVAPARLEVMAPIAFFLGFLLFGAMAALYALTPTLFPTSLRATGTGLALGLGRIGAAIGPYLGGVLIASGLTRAVYVPAMAAPLLICASLTIVVGRRTPGGQGGRDKL